MREISSLKLALYIALIVGTVSLGFTFFLPCGPLMKGMLPLAVAATTFALIKLGLDHFVYKRLEEINTGILHSIKNERVKSRLENTLAGPMGKLESSVKRLVKEKTIEIDNLKELERMRKEFLGDVAHELRSPIFNVQGYIHTLIEGALQDEEVSQKFLGKAAKHADHLSSLVEDLVTISRIEAGELKLEKIDFDLTELLREVIELQEMSARQKNITLQIKKNRYSKVIVNADRQKIRQVLMNLVSNSIKYGKEHGTTNIDLQADTSKITVEVADNGEGIAEEHLPRLFERFYRVDKSRNRNAPSTGLGLAIVKHFIEAHQQTIDVTSREGIGSIFSFTLQKVKTVA